MRYLLNRALCVCFIVAIFSACDVNVQTQREAAGELVKAPAKDIKIQAQKAVAGVGKQGQKLREHKGVAKIISGPVSALFSVKQKAALEIQVTQAVNLFRASEGRFPKSHQEFMDKCVTPNKIQLPELPEGAVYQFNSKKGELWVYDEDEVPED